MKLAHTIAPALLAVLAGCGIKPPAANLTFKPPDGWHAGPALGAYAQSWASPNNPKEELLLYRWGEYVDVEDLPSKLPILFDRVDSRRLIRICNQRPGSVQEAALVTGTGTWAGSESNVVMLVTDANSVGYFGTYVNPIGKRRPNVLASEPKPAYCDEPRAGTLGALCAAWHCSRSSFSPAVA